MEKNKKIEDEIFLEDTIFEYIGNAKTLYETNELMDEVCIMAENSPDFRTFSKIEKSINILEDFDKDLELRTLIVSKTLENLFPLINCEKEVITEEQITDLANNLGRIIYKHNKNDIYKDKCAQVWLETVLLRELIKNN